MFLWIYNSHLRIVAFCLLLLLPNNSVANTLKNQSVIDGFYSTRNGEPLWISHSKLNKAGKELLTVLKQSWQNGLNPNSYNVMRITQILDNSKRRLKEGLAIEIELLLTDGFVEYIRDLSGMRINANDMRLDPNHWKQRITAYEAMYMLPNNKKNIAKFIKSREPQTHTYQRLKSELINLVENLAPSIYTREKLVFKRTLIPNRKYNNTPKLRHLLGLKEVNNPKATYIYDDDLVNAVLRFQIEKGLKPDGLVGKQTLEALNSTDLDKVKQLIVNMERLRWIEDKKPSRFVVVNIPSATLWAIDNGNVKFEMPVIVGRKKRQTPSFVTYIHGVRFNPTWTIPPTIKLEDILPQLQKDPSYLSDKGIELYEGYDSDSTTIDPLAVDWKAVGKSDLHGFRMVQVPGKHNPLGNIRILMPNKHNIYLHDTNHKELFSRNDRAKSSGCVRMKNPRKMAEFALENRSNWGEKLMSRTLAKGKTKDVYIDEKIAIYLLYYTVWLGDKDQIIYGSDIYGHDKTLLQLLEKLDGFDIMRDNNTRIVRVVD